MNYKFELGKSPREVWEIDEKGEYHLIVEDAEEDIAKFIATAPDMAEAIEELVRQFGGISAVTQNQKKAIKEAKHIYVEATGIHLNL